MKISLVEGATPVTVPIENNHAYVPPNESLSNIADLKFYAFSREESEFLDLLDKIIKLAKGYFGTLKELSGGEGYTDAHFTFSQANDKESFVAAMKKIIQSQNI